MAGRPLQDSTNRPDGRRRGVARHASRANASLTIPSPIGNRLHETPPSPHGAPPCPTPPSSLAPSSGSRLLACTPHAEAAGPATGACAARGEVVAKLAQRFGETLRSVGLQRADGLVEVYASEKTGTWTILVTRPDGMSCLLAAGELWEEEPKRAPGEDA